MSGRNKILLLAGEVGEIEQPLALVADVSVRYVELYRGLRSYVEAVDTACSHRFAVVEQSPCHTLIVERTEEILIVYAYLVRCGEGGEDRLLHSLHLPCVRIGHTVGRYHTVVAEVPVRRVVIVPVASVCEYLLTVLTLPAYRLVYEVPDVSALEFGIFAEEVPVFLESSLGVTHGVGIFTLYHRAHVGLVIGKLLHTFVAAVHWAVDVTLAILFGALVLYGARRIHCLYILICGVEVGSIAGLVAERPHDDTRMVEVAGHVAVVALDCGFLPCGHFSQSLVAVSHTVALDVGLGGDIQAIAVAEVVPVGIVGVVACAHGVEVKLFHQLDILKHALLAHHISAVGVELVAVGALYQHGLAVDEQLAVLYLHAAEAHIYRYHLSFFPFGECSPQGVQVGSLGSPFLRSGYVKCLYYIPFGIFDYVGGHGLAGSVDEVECQFARAFHFSCDGKASVGIAVGQVALHAQVLYAVFVAGIQIVLTCQTRESEEILVFEVGAVTPAVNLHGDVILLAGYEIAGHVKLVLKFRVLAVTYKSSVDPQAYVGGGRAEVGYHILPFPVGGHFYRAAVRPYMIVLVGHERRIVVEIAAPGVADIEIHRVAVAEQFPVAGHIDKLPAAYVISFFPEVDWSLVAVAYPLEVPLSVERHKVF